VLLTSAGANIATFDVESRYTPNKVEEAKGCYGSTSIEHPAVLMISMERGADYCGGTIKGLNVPKVCIYVSLSILSFTASLLLPPTHPLKKYYSSQTYTPNAHLA
jgi:ATP sulfurylase